MTKHEYDITEKIYVDIDRDWQADLIVFNDDVNTFDWVIECFVEVCRLTIEESIIKTLYIHYNGKGVVRSGQYNVIVKMKNELVARGLSAIVGRSREN